MARNRTNTVDFLRRSRDIMLHAISMVESGRNQAFAIQQMRRVYSNFAGLQAGSTSPDLTRLMSTVSDCINAAEQEISQPQLLHSTAELLFHHPATLSRQPPRRRGPSAYNIPIAQIQFLINHGFSASAIARLFHVSLSTVRRRLRTIQMNMRSRYSRITNSELDDRVRHYTQQNRMLGCNSVLARLRSLGIVIQRHRVRSSLHRVDPSGVALRWSRAIQRRRYSVQASNSLWHIDGNHKLIRLAPLPICQPIAAKRLTESSFTIISSLLFDYTSCRYRIVIHGGIDGYSRLITFLRAADNNTSTTVLRSFLHAAVQYDVPSRVRCDHGGENILVGMFMLYYRGCDRGSILTGRSVHNQRIERLWVDVFTGCVHIYYELFHYLEEIGLLDIDNELHLFSLHYVFLTRLNRDLDLFRSQWNNHPLRTEHNRTPIQLFIQGTRITHASESNLSNFIHITNGESQFMHIGSDDQFDELASNSDSTVTVPPNTFPLSDVLMSQLQNEVDPLSETIDGCGINLYLRTIRFIANNT